MSRELTPEYLDYLTRDPAHLMPWIREIYPRLWAEYLGYEAAEGQPTERQQFAFELLQFLHQ